MKRILSSVKKIFFFSLIMMNWQAIIAQASYQDLKSALVIKLSNNINWANDAEFANLNIGIYGIDTANYTNLKSLSAGTKINDNTFTVSWIVDLNSLDQFQLIFIDKSKSSDLTEIVKKTEKKHILLISEQSDDTKNVMLNILHDESSDILSFEINKANLIIENFTFSDQLLLLGGTEVDLRNLYQEMKSRLEIEKKEVDNKSQELLDKQVEIKNYQQDIDEHRDSLSVLNTQTTILQKSIEQKEDELNSTGLNLEREKRLLQQQLRKSENQNTKMAFQADRLLLQERSIIQGTKKLDSLFIERDKLKSSLGEQQLTINTKQELIEAQKKMLYTFIVFSVMLTALSIATFWAFKNKRKIVKQLEKSNILLNEQHKDILQLNEELSASNDGLNEVNDTLSLQKTELSLALNELEKAQLHILQSEKMAALGVLTAGVAHEINNPLNFIHSGVIGLKYLIDDLNENLDSEESAKKTIIALKKGQDSFVKLVESVELGVTRVGSIVKSLGSFSHGGDVAIVACDVHEIIDNCMVILAHELKNLITVSKNYELDLKPIKGNQSKLYQVFLNLLTNSIQAMNGTEGEINIHTSNQAKGKGIKVIIEDTGEGINQDIMDKIFDPFFTTKPTGTGTGIGLSIVYNIINEHSGTIQFTSQKQFGTKVVIELPV